MVSDDLVRTFISRRVSPLQRRDHKICHTRGALDPTRISKHELDKASVFRRVNAIAANEMSDKWRWGVKPFYREKLPPQVSSPLSESTLTSSEQSWPDPDSHCLFCSCLTVNLLKTEIFPPRHGHRISSRRARAKRIRIRMTTCQFPVPSQSARVSNQTFTTFPTRKMKIAAS